LADNTYKDCVFVVVDYNSPDNLSAFLKLNHQKDIDSGRLVIYSYREPGAFRMAHAKNMAHRAGILEGADVLVNMDADNYTGPEFARYVAQQFDTPDPVFLWSRMIQNGPDKLPRGISGRIAVRSDAFLKAGGYDEQFEAWSPDDKDFNLRLRRLGYEGKEIDNRYLNAILHNDKMRFKEWGKCACHEDYFASVVDSDSTVVNFGKIGLGTMDRNYTGEPLELMPIPTRIFGIGMHKTATTSLHLALKILGYDTAHWKSAHWAKAIWEEMAAWGRSLTLEKHYALSDLPIAILYQELDKAYPGSKFILTVRNEGAWLESVRNHWSHESNPFRKAWDHDPFTHRVHKLTYGQKGFDAEVFLERYRRHNAEVKEYFKDRPDDLLVMDMDRGAGWGWLCGFLRVPVPKVPYPVAFPTKTKLPCVIIPERKKASMSLLKTIETIGQDILKGVEAAAPIILDFLPKAGPILQDILEIITALEGAGTVVTSAQMSTMVQAIATTGALKQAAEAKKVAAIPDKAILAT
jgi:hypothetical protein